jgi:hypothetical protein
MRRLWPLLALLLSVTPAFADTLDCAVIKSTALPVELAFDWTWTEAGKDPLAVQMRRQIIRSADETVLYEFFSPAKFTRRTLNGAGFRTQVRTAGEAASAARVSSYSIDVTKDYLGLGEPFAFQEVVKDPDGAVVSDIETSISFAGAADMQLGGCAYPLIKIIEESHGTARGKPGSNRSERWYSLDLKTSLYSRTENGNGAIVEIRARDISTSFTPVE